MIHGQAELVDSYWYWSIILREKVSPYLIINSLFRQILRRTICIMTFCVQNIHELPFPQSMVIKPLFLFSLPDIPMLRASSSAVNKDMMSKVRTNGDTII